MIYPAGNRIQIRILAALSAPPGIKIPGSIRGSPCGATAPVVLQANQARVPRRTEEVTKKFAIFNPEYLQI